MKNTWFINCKQIKNKANNQFPFSHYFKLDDKTKIMFLNHTKYEDIYNQIGVSIRNCKQRYIYNWILLLTCILISIFGIALFIGSFAIKDKTIHDHVLIAGIILFFIGLIVFVVLYFADNWNNPYLYEWKNLIIKLKPYLINQQNLPVSVQVLFYPFDADDLSNKNSGLDFLKYQELDQMDKKYVKEIKSLLAAKEADYNYKKSDDNTFNWVNSYKYWANILVIYEWALFLKKYIEYLDYDFLKQYSNDRNRFIWFKKKKRI